VHDGLLEPKLTFLTDEANFNLSGYINSQNNSYWSSENSPVIIRLPFTAKNQACDVRLAQTASLEGTLDAEDTNEIFNPIFVKLAPAEERFGYLMQDGASPHS
jgi:hypothetical protein